MSDLLLTDPDGRRTGINSITKLKYKEIPHSSYGDGDADAPMKELEIYGPPDGSYLLQVIGTATGPYSLYVHPLDENGDSPPNQPFFDNIPTLAGMIHTYKLEYTRTPGVPTKVTGGFEGGEEAQSEIDKLLTYAYPTAHQTEFRAKQTSFPLVILYGPTILPKTFRATLNGTDISRRFKPVPGGYQVVPLKFVRGSHTLILSVQGKITAGQVATDQDELVFNIP